MKYVAYATHNGVLYLFTNGEDFKLFQDRNPNWSQAGWIAEVQEVSSEKFIPLIYKKLQKDLS